MEKTTNAKLEVVNRLSNLNGDGSGHIQKLAEHIMVASETERIRDKVFRMWMIMACAAADHAESTPNKEAKPKFDSMLIFVGDEGIGKTRFFKAMLPEQFWQYFDDSVLFDFTSFDTRFDFFAQYSENWVVEIGDLDFLSGGLGVNRLNSLLSKSFDSSRKPYEEATKNYQRRTVFVGSTTEWEFLKSRGVNRRYWPLLIAKLITPNASLTEKAWAEAWTAYTNGEVWWPQTDFKKELSRHVVSFQLPNDQ